MVCADSSLRTPLGTPPSADVPAASAQGATIPYASASGAGVAKHDPTEPPVIVELAYHLEAQPSAVEANALIEPIGRAIDPKVGMHENDAWDPLFYFAAIFSMMTWSRVWSCLIWLCPSSGFVSICAVIMS